MYDSVEAICWLKENLRAKKFVPGYVSGIRCDAPIAGFLDAGAAMATGVGDSDLAIAAMAKQGALDVAFAAFKAAGCTGKETVGSCVTLQAEIVSAQTRSAAAYAAAFPEDVVAVDPSRLEFTTLDFDTVDHGILGGNLRTVLDQMLITNAGAIPISFFKGSIIAVVSAETEADKNKIDQGADQIIQGVLGVIGVGVQTNATGTGFEDEAARADEDTDAMPIWFYIVVTCGAALVFVLLGLGIARFSSQEDNELIVKKVNNLKFGVGVERPEDFDLQVMR